MLNDEANEVTVEGLAWLIMDQNEGVGQEIGRRSF